jgi:hypothetical protein
MAKYGQPDAVYAAGEVVNMEMVVDAKGAITGGVRGPGDGTGAQTAGLAGGGGFGGGMRGGMMGGGMPGGMGRMGGGMPPGMPGGMMGKMGGMMGGGPSGMMRGGAPMGMGGPGGMMGRMGGMPGMMGGGPPGMMGGGMNGFGNGAANNGPAAGTFAAAGGFIWVYYIPKKELAYEFYFNKDGRVEGILERGKAGGMPTSHGIGLGGTVRNIYNSYGWPDSMESQGPGVALNYNQKYHTYFSVLNSTNKITGVAVFLRESQRVSFFDGTVSSGGTGLASSGMMGRMGGMPGMPGGMAGRMGGMPGMPGGMPGMPGGMPGMPGGMAGGGRLGGKEGD